jgi:cell wall-associated protease
MKYSKSSILSCIALICILNPIFGQQAPKDWYHLDKSDGYNGTSTKKAFSELLKDKKGRTVIVAVIDSGIDAEHEDLKANMWVNEDEIPNNGIDDDKNGYVDDIHGWNFIGGPDGQNVGAETYEVTRLYGKYKYKYDNADPTKLTKDQRKEYDLYLKYKGEVEKEREKASGAIAQIDAFESNALKGFSALETALEGKENPISLLSDKDFFTTQNITKTPELDLAVKVAGQIVSINPDAKTIGELKATLIEELEGEKKDSKNKIEIAYNPDYDSRKLIVKDDYSNQKEKIYGNNDVEGPDALHGTHVAGIIGAVVGNDLGSEGIARNVKLMSVRAVPDGDERDKDVANAIIYAVDNGASIINMSFGKGHSWDKKVVNDAVAYAAKHDVLLVHAAGNSGQNNDVTENYPNDYLGKKGFLFFKKHKYAENWMEIGALSPKGGEDAPASFSNYGKKNVDLFSPGVQIYATTPDDKYQYLQGTSMASPVAAGVAAVLRSYYPSLTAVQVKDIMMKSVIPSTDIVKKPGTKGAEKVSFKELSVSGGTVNLLNAIKLAETVKGEKKVKSLSPSGV